MLDALRNSFQRLTGVSWAGNGGSIGSAGKTPIADPTVPNLATGSEVVTALNAFFKREPSYDKRNELFAALIARFVAHNPVESQVKAMFNAVLDKIVAPMHHSIFWGDRMLTLDK